MQKIKRAVFPAAGLGTRFLPATKSQPKEMLTIVDKPVIQYLVEEAKASGIEEIILITGRGKAAIENHFDHSFELEHHLLSKGENELLAEIRKLNDLAKFIYVRQPQPMGDGHAILCAKEILGDEPFAVMFGDDVVDHKVPALKQLMDVYEKTGGSVLGLERIPKHKSTSYGMIHVDSSDGRIHKVGGLVEKPAPEDAPSDLGIIGKYIVTPEIIQALKASEAGHCDGEIRLIDGLRRLMETQDIYGYEIEGERYDTGDKFGLVKAIIDFSLKRDDLGDKVREHIRGLDLD